MNFCGERCSLERYARGITPDDGDEDDEQPLACKRMKVQGVITARVDTGVQEGLLQMHEGEDSWAAHTRLAERGPRRGSLWRLNLTLALTDLRPAEILSSALGNAHTALDISICSPHAQQAGSDCTRSSPAAKMDYNCGEEYTSLFCQVFSTSFYRDVE